MNRLTGLLKKDFKIAYRNYYFLIVLVVAVLLILVVNFLIPERIDTGPKILYAVEGEQSEETRAVISSIDKQAKSERLEGREDVIKGMEADRESLGLVIGQSRGRPSFEIIMQGYESRQSKNAFALSIEAMLDAGKKDSPDIQTVVLNQGTNRGEIPFNKSFVPLMILNEPVMLGFILLATLIFMEKGEGTIKAYMVSPGGLTEYLVSKIILICVLGLLSAVLITVFTVGFGIHWPMLIGITIAGSLFSSTTALFIASIFDTLSKAMVWVMGISLLLTAPMISYFMPGFSPVMVTAIPTYSLMFAIREAVFPAGNKAIFYQSMAVLLAISTVLFVLSVLSYRRSLLGD
jgi:ABC-type Na+ efflux pump permease subunit